MKYQKGPSIMEEGQMATSELPEDVIPHLKYKKQYHQ